ncbi:hypothetical protein [Pseudoalteromonas sp. H105]|uniref:hypothetical protein n=1 Tax=Pseudoalteromonas sp. H105 TaxID=1348393 RepID=UPI0007322A43|nr:hypothetical protein [Pseudoalteromonas sp. H105]KTF18221.1 hypothetical protein ATS75_02070 [Pseudoalteromonas sp. H105]
MDRIETIVESIGKVYPELESGKFELVFSFRTEKAAKEYFMKIYHWEHHDTMVSYQLNADYLSGFKIDIDLNAKHLKYLTDSYVVLASETQGNLYRWKLWI